jgi:hypothetical protein
LRVLDVLEVDRDSAQAIHQRVLEQRGDDTEAVVLAHQHVWDVLARLARPPLLAGCRRREPAEIVAGGEHPHQTRHHRFDDVGELRRHDRGGALLLVAVGLSIVIVERLLTDRAERGVLVGGGRLLLLAQ